MGADKRKIAIVGAGAVGMSYAYALLNRSACDELVILDKDKKRAEGEVMDLNHGLAFAQGHMRISLGNYKDCADADIVVISAGISQRQHEGRNSLLSGNCEVVKSIIKPVVSSGFSGIFVVVTNPVDIMAYLTYKLSGFPAKRVIGSGTLLDTSRLKYLLGEDFRVAPQNVHAYVMGEHGDSVCIPWSIASISSKPIRDVKRGSGNYISGANLEEIGTDVKFAAQQIIAAKGATNYGIGMSMMRITNAILGNENSVLTVSAYLNGEYGQHGVYAGVPCIVNRGGIDEILEFNLSKDEQAKMQSSCDGLRKLCKVLDMHQSPELTAQY